MSVRTSGPDAQAKQWGRQEIFLPAPLHLGVLAVLAALVAHVQ